MESEWSREGGVGGVGRDGVREWSREGGVGGVERDGVRVVQGRRSWGSKEGWSQSGPGKEELGE